MIIENRQFDEERALYALRNARIRKCVFAGEADGESALKEARGITAEECDFRLRYPFWHTTAFEVKNCSFADTARASFWYASDGKITGCRIDGVKCLRECSDITVTDSTAVSPEFGWKCRDITLRNCSVTSEYFLLDSRRVILENVELRGKYSFQYTENVTAVNCRFDTKDAFWHTKNAVVKDSVINGEYLGWYSDGLTLINCKIFGTQPLCYCKNLRLVNCTMEGADLAFEYSDAEAQINGAILSVKNPLSGHIHADSIGEIILSDAVKECTCEITVG